MNSCLYVGRVNHCRFLPRRHAFSYRLFMCYLDLDELPGLYQRLRLLSPRRFSVARFARNDHLSPELPSLKQAVQQKVLALGGPELSGPVRLLTHLRYFGFGFNPVSFYFCFDSDGETLRAVLAEVNNTPWGEQHCYLLPVGDTELIKHQQAKAFHVSPFMDQHMNYHWCLTRPSEQLTIRIENYQQQQRLFLANLSLQRQPLENRHFLRALLRFPLMTLKVIVAIYFEALRLWLKKIPLHKHTATDQNQSQEIGSP